MASVLLPSTALAWGGGRGASGWSQHVSGPFFVFLGPTRTTPILLNPPVGAVLTCFTAPIVLALRRVEGALCGCPWAEAAAGDEGLSLARQLRLLSEHLPSSPGFVVVQLLGHI